MRRFKRFKGRTMLLLSLVVALSFISYLNFAINKYSLLETSSDFEKYEENKLAETSATETSAIKDLEEDIIIDESEDNKTNGDLTLVDSSESQVPDLVMETSSNIVSSFNKEGLQRSNYFIEARLNTSIEREKMVELLNEIINNEKTDEGNRQAANDAKMKLVDYMSKEKVIENLIMAKGFEEALVFITDHSVNVIVEAEKLKDADVAKILDIVLTETNVAVENIKIQNKY